jgi:hypothetical protein
VKTLNLALVAFCSHILLGGAILRLLEGGHDVCCSWFARGVMYLRHCGDVFGQSFSSALLLVVLAFHEVLFSGGSVLVDVS